MEKENLNLLLKISLLIIFTILVGYDFYKMKKRIKEEMKERDKNESI